MSLLLKLSLVIYAVLVTIYCFQKKFRSQRWLRIFSKMLCSVGFLLVAATCGLESGFRKEPLWSWGIFAALAFSALGDLFLVLQKGEAGIFFFPSRCHHHGHIPVSGFALIGRRLVCREWPPMRNLRLGSQVLARRARHVIGGEIVPEAIRDAEESARRNGVGNVEFLCGISPWIARAFRDFSPGM